MIGKVADGSPIGNVFRFFGKTAPTGIVSGGIAFGLPAVLGSPALGAALLGTGVVGRQLATRSTMANAQRALDAALTRSVNDL